MQHVRFSHGKTAQRLCLCALTLLLLVPSFFSNAWHVAERKRFLDEQAVGECLIAGRMVKTRRDGIVSAGGLTGAWVQDTALARGLSDSWLSPQQARDQYAIYFNGAGPATYAPYLSQTGGQAMLYSVLDGLIPAPPRTRLALLHLLTSLLSAVALTLIILWFHAEFGSAVAMTVACSTVLSQWLTVFGSNLWWSLWAFYLPMIAAMYFLKKSRAHGRTALIAAGILCFAAVFAKCLVNGFEFITTTLVMMLIPFVYYAIRHGRGVRLFLKETIAAMTGACLAVCLSLAILSFQIAAVKGSVRDGVEHIVYSFGKRTHGQAHDYPDPLKESLEAPTLGVLVRYLAASYFDFNNYLTVSSQFLSGFVFKIRYAYLIAVFLAMSGVVLLRAQSGDSAELRARNVALVCAAWASMLAPLSWFVVFKAHSFVHAGINFILWQMPFTFFGFAVCGVAVKSVFGRKDARSGRRSSGWSALSDP